MQSGRVRVLVAAVMAGVLLAAGCGGRTAAPVPPSGGSGQAGQGEYGGGMEYGGGPGSPGGDGRDAMPAAREVEVELDNFYFEPATIELKVGETVTLRLANESGAPHTFTVGELGIDVVVSPGETATVTVTPEREGEFQLVCSYHAARGMEGTVVVRR